MIVSVHPETGTRRHAFTLVELLVSITIIAVLSTIGAYVYNQALDRARAAKSMGNLRQLAAANLAYAADNNGQFCPAQDKRNRVRWHGSRSGSGGRFDPTNGFLSPYLGRDGRVSTCPIFREILEEGSFETGTGGYGYNATYIGGSPGRFYEPEVLPHVPYPARTVMFTTTAFAKSGGAQEYPYTEPFRWVNSKGRPVGKLQPSTHFRANGKALVAWCDGHITAELPNKNKSKNSPNFYGGDNDEHSIGWFGPSDQNGYWNPRADPAIFRPTSVPDDDFSGGTAHPTPTPSP